MARTPRLQNGAAIRHMRHARDISAGELAQRLGVKPVTVWNIESGHQSASWRLLYRLAGPDALDVPIERLLSDHGRAELAEVTP